MTENTSGITPADVKVLILPDPVETKSAGGILFTDTAKEKDKFAAVKGKLVARGPNAFIEWGEPNIIPLGSRVAYAQYAGRWMKGGDGTEYLIMNDEDVIGVLSDG